MTTESSTTEEPRLTLQPQQSAFFRHRTFRRLFAPSALLALCGLVALLLSGHLLLPFEPVTTLKGKMASKADFFEDEEVQKILMKHHIRVDVTRSGSRDIATRDIDIYDFVFPSGQPAADLIKAARGNRPFRLYEPFVSPIVLATYREYAETLRHTGVATPQGDPSAENALYYDLDIKQFIKLIEDGRRWNDIRIPNRGATNGNKVLAQTSDVCRSNSAATYLGLVSFVANDDDVPTTEQQADDLARQIKRLLTGQGMPAAERLPLYLAPEGKGEAPVVVIYEHQYLAYQLDTGARFGQPDADRVLLYPSIHSQTRPEFIALKPDAERLGQLVTSDPELRRRAMELGLRVFDTTGATNSGELSRFLQQRGIPIPAIDADDTKVDLPTLPLLERMITIVGDCPPAQPSAGQPG